MRSENLVTMVVLVTLITAATAVIVVPWLIKNRERMKVHETIRYFVDKGQSPPVEVLSGLVEPPRAQPVGQRDLRTGVIWISIAFGIAGVVSAVVSVSDPGDASWVMVPALAAFPASIGLGYVLLWLVNRDKRS